MVAWLTQSRDDMIQLHKPRERAAGSGFRPGAPKVLVSIALLDDPGTPRAHARGVRFCAEEGCQVRRATAELGRASCRVRGCHNESRSGVAVSFKKQKHNLITY